MQNFHSSQPFLISTKMVPLKLSAPNTRRWLLCMSTRLEWQQVERISLQNASGTDAHARNHRLEYRCWIGLVVETWSNEYFASCKGHRIAQLGRVSRYLHFYRLVIVSLFSYPMIWVRHRSLWDGVSNHHPCAFSTETMFAWWRPDINLFSWRNGHLYAEIVLVRKHPVINWFVSNSHWNPRTNDHWCP